MLKKIILFFFLINLDQFEIIQASYFYRKIGNPFLCDSLANNILASILLVLIH